MTSTNSPFGLRPLRVRGAGHNAEGTNTYRIANGRATAIFYGDPVTFTTSGTVVLASTTGSLGSAIGIFMGCMYNDPTNDGRPTWSRHFPANTSSAPSPTKGLTFPQAFVLDNARATFAIQADASVTSGDVGWNFQVSIGTSGGAGGKTSSAVLKASTRALTTELIQVVGIYDTPSNAFSDIVATDAFPVVEARWNVHRDNLISVT